MSRSKSVLAKLLQIFPQLQPQMYFKASLTALSHAMEDQILAGKEKPLVIASFQRERFYRQEAQRYRRIANKTDQVYVLAAPENEFKNSSQNYETIAFQSTETLSKEWHLIVIGMGYVSCLVCQEKVILNNQTINPVIDNNRRFEGIWTFDRRVAQHAADILLNIIVDYCPELKNKIEQARQKYLPPPVLNQIIIEQKDIKNNTAWKIENANPDPFVQRLVTYLQAGHYKLIKANRSLAAKEHKERLINSITTAIRLSLNSEEILQTAVQKLGKGLGICRCLVYRCKETDDKATVEHEFLNQDILSIKEQVWFLYDNPLFQEVIKLQGALTIDNTTNDPRIINSRKGKKETLQTLVKNYSILSWMLAPILYRGQLLGMLELHHCGPRPISWKEEDVTFINAITTQIGVALIQAEAYAHLQDLNEQLEALDYTRSNLVAITGHELRTPLSTIQVCLESLTLEPDMSLDLRQVMLNTALQDAERMRKLIQDFLILSRLESGRVELNTEVLNLNECLELSLSNIKALYREKQIPRIETKSFLNNRLPLVKADGEWLVEVLAKLLDNACKFTSKEGKITIEVNQNSPHYLEVTIADTGRGIETKKLETIFDRFYQEEGALRRSIGGTGLGLAICRQIVQGWDGEIWAESKGKEHGSQFHFTVPIHLT